MQMMNPTPDVELRRSALLSGSWRITAADHATTLADPTPQGLRVLVTTDAAIATHAWPQLLPHQAILRIKAVGATRWQLSTPPTVGNWSDYLMEANWAEMLLQRSAALDLSCDAVCHRMSDDDNAAQAAFKLSLTVDLARQLGAQRVICRVAGRSKLELLSWIGVVKIISTRNSFPILAETTSFLAQLAPTEVANVARLTGLRLCLDFAAYGAKGISLAALTPLLPAVDSIHARHFRLGESQLLLATRKDDREFRWWIEELHRLGCRAPITIDYSGGERDHAAAVKYALLALSRFT